MAAYKLCVFSTLTLCSPELTRLFEADVEEETRASAYSTCGCVRTSYTFVTRPQAKVKSALTLTNLTHMDIKGVLVQI